eukprot:SAG11_NODE_7242_length_1173_cov_4.294227_1_plen_149_part_10
MQSSDTELGVAAARAVWARLQQQKQSSSQQSTVVSAAPPETAAAPEPEQAEQRTFCVDKVTPSAKRLTPLPPDAHWEKLLDGRPELHCLVGREVLAISATLSEDEDEAVRAVVDLSDPYDEDDDWSLHGLLASVKTAFGAHYPCVTAFV